MAQSGWRTVSSRCPPLLGRLWREERGANMVILALALMVLFGFGGIAIDGGNAYYQQQRMQIAADAAALGGARALALGQDTDAVDARIRELALANHADSVTWNYINEGRGVHVVAYREFDTYFARLYGYNTFDVTGQAEAQYEPVTDTDNLFPMTYSCNCLDGGESTFPIDTPDDEEEDEDISAEGCELYPIALHESNINVQWGDTIYDIYNGVQPGNFGWLSWDGQNNAPALATELTPPGNSSIYTNPNDPDDHAVSIGDWVQGLPGVDNSSSVRDALDVLMTRDIVVPVWGTDGIGIGAVASGSNSLYYIVNFAQVRITDYRLPSQNRISAAFHGLVRCNEETHEWVRLEDPPASTVNLRDTANSEYEIAYVSHENNTWTYRVSKLSGGDINSWSLGAAGCNVLSSNGEPTVGADAISWTLPSGFTTGEFSFTLDAEYMAAPLAVTVESGPGSTTATLTGPNCAAPVGGGGGTNPGTELSVCLPPLDFETDDAGGSLVRGQIIDNEWAAWGVHVTTNSPGNHPAMVFDSAIPTGGDTDLGTPGLDFAGPGRGAGGGNGKPGQNNQALGKLLIISEDNDASDPDDNGGGGTVVFTFDIGVRMDDVYILDIDDYTAAGTVRAYSDTAGGNLLVANSMLGLGDNGVQLVPVNATGVRRLEIEFPGSGSIPAIVSCRTQTTGQYALGDIIWNDVNNNGVQDNGEPGIKDVELELYTAGLGQIVAKTTTNGSGKYLFKNLPAGSYSVKVASANFNAGGPLEGAVAGLINVGGDDALDSDFSAGMVTVSLPLNGGNNLDVDGGYILPEGAGVDVGPQSATVSLSDNKSTQYEIALDSHEGDTWTYRVREIQGWDMKQWNLGIANCMDHIEGYSPGGASLGLDSGITGIKWSVDKGFSDGYFSITLDDTYVRGSVNALAKSVKGGQAEVVIAGPDCSQVDDTTGGEIPDGGEGDTVCDFRWVDWNGGATTNMELKQFMDTTALSGDWKLGDVIEPGPPVSNDALINASLANRVGDEMIIPLTEWNGAGYQVCGFAQVRLLGYDFSANPLQMSIQFLKGLARSGASDPAAPDYGVFDVRMLD